MTARSSLVCRELRLRQFRNFAELDLTLPAGGVALIGDNGSGKTNFLEAIYYLEIFRSFRGAREEQLVRFGADAFHVRGRFEDRATGGVREVTAAFERRGRRKRVTLDQVEPDRLADAIGRIGLVIFSPSDVALVAGGPAERRRFLDILLSLNRTGYLTALQRYRHILRQRNALLREGAPSAVVAAWDPGLVEAGARIIEARAAWLAAYAEAFARCYAAIAGGAAARLHYLPGVPVDRASGAAAAGPDIAAAFHLALERNTARERERGVTLAGPHRDDLLMALEGNGASLDLREFGSGGQQRTAAIALRLVEAETVRQERGREPLTLLDDVFAELDPGRSRRLLELLEAGTRGQVILTAPKPSDLEPHRAALAHWRMAEGKVYP
ncbi:MAG: DNA replication and repair protein RecF [Gemmatimonadetes bacterium]|nr:DNA replication and repair protein RecF [Gemmatimonadota bacterium]